MLQGPCQLCGRETLLTRHHLIPQSRHRNKWNKKNFSRTAVKSELLLLCSACHKQIHALLSEKELERGYSTLEAIREHPGIREFVEWIRAKPPGFRPRSLTTRTSGRLRAQQRRGGG